MTRPQRRISAPSGVSLVAGMVFVVLAILTLGALAWGLWFQLLNVAAPIILVLCGVVGMVWAQRASSARTKQRH